MLVYIQLQLLNLMLSNRASLGLSRQHSCNKVELTVLKSATSSPGEDLQQDVLKRRMSVAVYLIQPDENHGFTAWIGLKWVTSAWKVCRWEWQVKPAGLLLWREAWFLSNPKDCTVAQLGMLLSSFSLLCSVILHFLKRKKDIETLNLWGFKGLLALLNYAWKTHKDSFRLWKGHSSDFALELAPQISSPKSTATIKKRDVREEDSCGSFSLLFLLSEALGAGSGDNTDEGGPSFCGSLAPEASPGRSQESWQQPCHDLSASQVGKSICYWAVFFVRVCLGI